MLITKKLVVTLVSAGLIYASEIAATTFFGDSDYFVVVFIASCAYIFLMSVAISIPLFIFLKNKKIGLIHNVLLSVPVVYFLSVLIIGSLCDISNIPHVMTTNELWFWIGLSLKISLMSFIPSAFILTVTKTFKNWIF